MITMSIFLYVCLGIVFSFGVQSSMEDETFKDFLTKTSITIALFIVMSLAYNIGYIIVSGRP